MLKDTQSITKFLSERIARQTSDLVMAELKSIADSTDGRQVIIIEDGKDVSGQALLKHFAYNNASQGGEVHLVCCENAPNVWLKDLGLTSSSKIHTYDCFSDPLGWESRQPVVELSSEPGCVLRCDTTDDLERTTSGRLREAQGHPLVVVDGLSTLLRRQGAPWSCRWLRSMAAIKPPALSSSESSVGVTVVALVHADLHADTVLSSLHHIASASLSLSPSPSASDSLLVKKFSSSIAARDCVYLCEVTRIRPSGKVVNETCMFAVSQSFSLLSSLYDASVDSVVSAGGVPGSAADPTANLTFNLRLTSEQKEARSNVVLPYTKQAHKRHDRSVTNGPASGQLGGGGGQIHYQPDDADDFDEDDPDDDLDI